MTLTPLMAQQNELPLNIRETNLSIFCKNITAFYKDKSNVYFDCKLSSHQSIYDILIYFDSCYKYFVYFYHHYTGNFIDVENHFGHILLLLLLILLLLSIYDLICSHTQEARANEQPPIEAQPGQLRRERIDRDLRSLLATCTDECVCQVEHCSLRCPEVRFSWDLQGESFCGPDGSRCALCKTFCQHAAALCSLLDTSGATRTALTSQ